MAEIFLSERELRDRRGTILRLLAPLVADRNRINIRQIGTGRKYTLGLLQKGINPASINNANDIRVQTKVDGVFVNYYEMWLSDQKSADQYLLERAYLHLHLKRAREVPDKQILCLHCDPLVAAGDGSYAYKRGPHLHVLGASPSIDRSHISVCLSDANLGGADAQALTQTLSAAVRMIELEFFPQYELS